jgi:hypothetical protein
MQTLNKQCRKSMKMNRNKYNKHETGKLKPSKKKDEKIDVEESVNHKLSNSKCKTFVPQRI